MMNNKYYYSNNDKKPTCVTEQNKIQWGQL
jgi:hypothetical protein